MPSSLQQPRAHKQPKGRATPQLVPEYEQVVSLLLHEMPALDKKHCLQSPCKHVPVGSKLLRSEKKGKMFLCILPAQLSICEGSVGSICSFNYSGRIFGHSQPDSCLEILHCHLRGSVRGCIGCYIHQRTVHLEGLDRGHTTSSGIQRCPFVCNALVGF